MQSKDKRNIEDVQELPYVKAFGRDSDISKVKKYGWDSIGAAGRFELIDKNRLKIDLIYQRQSLNKSRVLKIARKFLWPVFGALTVAETEQGFFILDGGHRYRAAMLRDDVKSLPCMVYKVGGTSDEAYYFWLANTGRKNVSAFENHKSAVVAGIDIAVESDKLVKKYGYEFAQNASRGMQTSCITTIYWMLSRDKKSADTAFRILAEAAQGTPIKQAELKGFFYIIQMNPMVDFGTFPLDNLIKFGLEYVRQEIRRATLIHKRGDYTVAASAILPILNKGQKKQKLVLPPIGSSYENASEPIE